MIIYKQYIPQLIAIFSALVTTYYISSYLQINIIYSSLLASLALYILNRLILKKPNLNAFIYCGSFIGMTTTKVNSYLSFAILSSITTFILTYLLRNKFNGFGGKLGSIAFISSIVSLLLLKAQL